YVFFRDARGRFNFYSRILPDEGRHRARVPQAERISSVDWGRLLRQRPARAVRLPPPPGPVVRRGRVKLSRSDLAPVAAALTTALAAAFRTSLHLLAWSGRVAVAAPGVGRYMQIPLGLFPAYHYFKLAPGAEKFRPGRVATLVWRNTRSRQALARAVAGALYAGAAAELLHYGLIGAGSAARVRRVPGNAGRSRTKWRTRDGRAWRGARASPARLTYADWEIYEATKV
ncbi:MAG: hypothetical protein ACRD2F_05310, partial [Terriglobales bacterium]